MNTIIVYGSKYGFTKKCVDRLAKELHGKVDLQDLKNGTNITISEYDTIIIGGSIYAGRIQKEVTEFCTMNLEDLKDKNIGLFICGMQEGDAVETELTQNYNSELVKVAIAKDYFGGEFNFEKMNFIEKFIVKKISKVTSSKTNLLAENIHRFAQAMNS